MNPLEMFLNKVKEAAEETLVLIAEQDTVANEEEIAPKVKGKKKAGKKAEPVESEDEDASNDDMGFDSDDSGDDESNDTVTMDDVREAFQAFVAKHKDTAAGRLAASKILAKFKVKKITELDEDDFSKAIEETNKKK